MPQGPAATTPALELQARPATTQLRVLHVSGLPGPEAGGSARAAQEMCEALAAHGVDTHRYCVSLRGQPQWWSARRPAELEETIRVPIERGGVTLTYFPARWPWRYAYSPELRAALESTVRSFDVVHVHLVNLYTTHAVARVASASGVPYVLQPHGAFDRQIQGRRRIAKRIYNAVVESRNLKGASAVQFTTREELAEALAQGVRRGVVVPLGLDMGPFRRLPPRGSFRTRRGLTLDTKLVVYSGRLATGKGLELLVRAFGRIDWQRTDIRLVIAGPGDPGMVASIRALIRQRRLEERAMLVGMLERSELMELLVDADAWVLPSRSENFGLAVLEALACGAPAIITDGVKIHHRLSTAGAALVISYDEAQLAYALQRVLGDAALATRLRTIGPRVVASEFSWTATTAQQVELYQGLIKKEQSA